MRKLISGISALLLVGVLSVSMVAQTGSAARNDATVQTAVTQKLAQAEKFHNVTSKVEDGIVTLAGTVDLYQDKLDAAKAAKKIISSIAIPLN